MTKPPSDRGQGRKPLSQFTRKKPIDNLTLAVAAEFLRALAGQQANPPKEKKND